MFLERKKNIAAHCHRGRSLPAMYGRIESCPKLLGGIMTMQLGDRDAFHALHDETHLILLCSRNVIDRFSIAFEICNVLCPSWSECLCLARLCCPVAAGMQGSDYGSFNTNALSSPLVNHSNPCCSSTLARVASTSRTGWVLRSEKPYSYSL